MLKNILIVALVAALTAGLTLYFDHGAPAMPGMPERASAAAEGTEAPDFTVTDLKGKPRALSDFRGKIVILNFWASWCPPCLKEFPDLLAVAAAARDDVVLLALSSDFEEEPMSRFLRKLERQNPESYKLSNIVIARDEDAAITQGLFQTQLLPETILIDRKGVMRRKIPGANWTREEMEAFLKDL